MPKVSVIIPVYNRQNLIIEALRSVENQYTKPIEVIVVDDGSTDDTVKMVTNYSKTSSLCISILKNKRRKGVSGARNWGVVNSKGKFIAFLDSDDLWAPDHLRQLSVGLEKYSEASLAFSAVDFFGEASDVAECSRASKGLVDRVLKESFKQKEDAIWVSTKNLLNSVLVDGVPFRCPGSLTRRDIFFDKKLLFDEDVSYTEDGLFLMMAAAYSKFLYVNDIGLHVRRHAENDRNAMYTDKIPDSCDKMVVKLKDFFKDQKLDPKTKKTLKTCLIELQYDAMSGRLNNKNIMLWMREALKFIIRLPGWTSMKMSTKLIVKRILSLNETN